MKHRKSLLALGLAAALMVSCTGCGGSKTTAYEKNAEKNQDTSAETAGLKIAYSSVAGETEAPWIGVLWDQMETLCQEKGWELDALTAGGVPSVQDGQIDQLLANDPDYFVIFAGDAAMADGWVKKIHNAGVPVIMLGVDATGSVQEYVSAFVGPDQEALASQLATDMIQANGASAGLNVVAISGFECQQDYILRERGYEKTLSYFSNYSLLATEYAGSSREEAKAIMEGYLETYGNSIDAVMCYDSEFAMGALEAIEASGREDIQIYSITGSNEVFDAVKDGRVNEVAIFSSDELADACAEVIDGLEQGVIPDHYIYVERTYVNESNVADYAGQGEY